MTGRQRKTLLPRPRFDKRSVDREVLIGQESQQDCSETAGISAQCA
jgi:hypothetical protein